MPKLVRSYALDAIETSSEEAKKTSKREVDRFFKVLLSTKSQEFPAVGLGTDMRLNGQMIAGGALVDEGRLVHLGAFPLTRDREDTMSNRESRIRRASHRRRIH